ncbi:unnamed protein product [Mucor hiemalis]
MTTATEHAINPISEESHKVFVGNLSFTSTDESLREYFGDAGEIVETIIIKKGSRPKGYGFVAFKTLKEAEKAVNDYHKKELDGREISVQLAKPREEPIKPATEKKKPKRKSKKSRKSAEVSEAEEEKVVEIPSPIKPETEETKPKTSVFVANLPLKIDKDQLEALFKNYQVESALVAIKRSGRSKGYGFVEFKTVEEMEKVLKEFVNVEVEGRPIHVSAATSEKNTERKLKPKKTKQQVEEPTTGEKKKSSGKNKKSAKKSSANEGIAAAKGTQDAVVELKKEDGVEAALKAQGAVKEVKKEDGVEAAHKAQDAVKEVKKEDGVEAAHKAQGAVKEVKKNDGVEAAHKAQGAVKEVKKEDGVDAAHKAQDAVKEVKKEDGIDAAKDANIAAKSS